MCDSRNIPVINKKLQDLKKGDKFFMPKPPRQSKQQGITDELAIITDTAAFRGEIPFTVLTGPEAGSTGYFESNGIVYPNDMPVTVLDDKPKPKPRGVFVVETVSLTSDGLVADIEIIEL